jgi:hypothetical protein
MDANPQPRTTTAFYLQSVASFSLSLLAIIAGIFYLPVGGWIRAFLAVGMLYCVTSAFTLAKCVRDAQEGSTVVRRIDQARVEKLLADHDPFRP